jgi:hypothetical protein
MNKDGKKRKKKITFGCQQKHLYMIQHAMKMKNKEAGDLAGFESSELYSQKVKKTLLRVPRDKGARGVEGLSMPCRHTTKRAKETTECCSFHFNVTAENNEDHAQWIVGAGGNVEHCGHAKWTASEASQSATLVAEEEIAVTIL